MEHSAKRQASSTQQQPQKKQKKRRRSEAGQIAKREADRSRAQTRINIGAAAYPRWKRLQQEKGLKLDADVALLLLDTYMLYNPLESKPRKPRPPPPLSSIGAESDRIKMGVTTSSDEDWYGEEEDGSDDDYVPSLCARAGGGALQRLFQVESLPATSADKAPRDDAPDGEEEPPTPDTSSSSPEHPRVWCEEEDDTVGQKAFLTYENNLRQLTAFLRLPVTKCGYLDDTSGMECDGTPPYEVHIRSRGTAAIIQWVCSREHCIWKWKSQPAIRVEALQPCLHPPD